MFEWASIGMGTTTIAHKLTDMNVPIPSIYKKINRPHAKVDLNNGNWIWLPQTVKSILENEMYLGHMVQGKWKNLATTSKDALRLQIKITGLLLKITMNH